MREILYGDLREIEGNAIAEHSLHRTQAEKHCPPPSLQGDADVDKAKHEPLRHAAVKPACGKKGDRKQRQQQHSNDCGSRMDTFFPDADLDNHRHSGEAGHQHQNIPKVPAHGQRKCNRNHAHAGYNAEHALAQADAVIGDDIKPFFYHEVPYPSEHVFFIQCRQFYIPAICPQSSS